VVRELIQEDCSGEKIGDELDLILNNQHYRAKMIQNYDQLAVRMGAPGASSRGAELMIKYLKLQFNKVV
jgi:lipid-A-disaccharide synthase